jgi:hypothetical protein
MQKAQVLNLGAFGLVLLTLVVCRATPRLETVIRVLPIDRFPRQIGPWHVDRDIPTDPEVQRSLPTATIVERDYVDPLGRHIDLLLLNARDDQDYHKPEACLPGQGAAITKLPTVMVDGRPTNAMRSTQDGMSDVLLYYWVKLPGRGEPAPGSLVSKVLQLRRLVDHENLSLFVRITMPDRPQDRLDLVEFAGEVWKGLTPILGDHGEVVLRD